jgi:uncharacterized damage-inducible protein DinB
VRGVNHKLYCLSMEYEYTAIAESAVPKAQNPLLQHTLDTYAGEINKSAFVWGTFDLEDPAFRPHERSSTVLEILRHQLLSERRFFAEFLGSAEPPASAILPADAMPRAFVNRLVELALPRLQFLAEQNDAWWVERVPFFDVERERIWIFWRRVLHTAHHRTQLTVYLRPLGKPVVSTYGPTADVTWIGADPTLTVDAASRGRK